MSKPLQIAWLVFILAVVGWASWLCRYEPLENGYFLDRWQGEIVDPWGSDREKIELQ